MSEAFAHQDQTSINDKKILFVRHAYADMERALLLKKAVDGCFTNVILFDASDSGTIKPGEDWVHSVLDNLRRSTLVIVIATERSMKRPWVWFEAGRVGSEALNCLHARSANSTKELSSCRLGFTSP